MGLVGVLTLLIQPLSAQILDFDTPRPPTLDQPTAADLLIEELEDEITRLDRALDQRPVTEAKIALRRLAQDLLRDTDAPDARLWGLTIARGRELLDAELDAAPPAVAVLLRNDIDIPRFDLPTTPADRDRFLRDAFAELATQRPIPEQWGWVPVARDLLDEQTLRAWLDASLIDDDTRSTLAQLMDLARRWTVYAPGAAELARVLRSAANLLDFAQVLDDETRAEARAVFARAARDLLVPELRDDAMNELEALAALARPLAWASATRDRDIRLALTKTVAEHIEQLAAAEEPAPSDTLEILRTVMDQVDAARSLPSEDTLVRPLRPAWRAIVADLSRSADRLVELIPRILDDPDPMSSPSIVAPLAAHRRLLEVADMLTDLSDAIRDPDARAREPVVREDRRLLAATLLRLGQRLDDARQRSDALDELRRCAQQLRTLEDARVPEGEGDWRVRARTEHATMSGQWVQLWSKPRDEEQEDELTRLARRIELLAGIAERARDLDLVRSEQARADLNAWPAWELAPHPLDVLLAQAPERLAQTAEVFLEGNLARTAARLDAYDDEYAVPALMAHLIRTLRAAGLSSRSATLPELCAGTPQRPAILRDHRDDLARVCLLIAEIPAARHRNDPADERDIRRYANYLARNLLTDLEPTTHAATP